MNHAERKHSKFSASGAERWMSCPGSVALSEGIPDKPSPYAEEGTRAHEVLEAYLRYSLFGTDDREKFLKPPYTAEMRMHADRAARFIVDISRGASDVEVLVESRIPLFLHEEAFGTFDSAVIEVFGTLHVFDYKYGIAHVAPYQNYQMIFYAMALAFHYDWNFKRVKMWIIQPRVRGYDGPTFWEIAVSELRSYVDIFREKIDRVEREPEVYVEGKWCHFCRAKTVCPIKVEAKAEQAKMLFSNSFGGAL